METTPTDKPAEGSMNQVITYSLRLLALALLLVWCFRILEPFITIFVWGAIIAIAMYPMSRGLASRLKNKSGLAATIMTILMMFLILAPSIWLLIATVDEVKELKDAYQAGSLHVPPPSDKVKDWPVVGKQLHALWSDASASLSQLIADHQEQARSAALSFLNLLKSTVLGIGLFALSIIASGVMMAYANPLEKFSGTLFTRLAGSIGPVLVESAGVTVRNVAKGVLGVAVIQSILAGFGLVLAGVPLAGLWIVVCLILAIVQVGLLPVSLGSIIYVWSTGETLTATIFTIWMLFVGVVDNILKPIMLGRGAPAPMLVVFLGAIGGFLFSGFSGLFTGAIILTLGYKLLMVWLEGHKALVTEKPAQETPPEP